MNMYKTRMMKLRLQACSEKDDHEGFEPHTAEYSQGKITNGNTCEYFSMQAAMLLTICLDMFVLHINYQPFQHTPTLESPVVKSIL